MANPYRKCFGVDNSQEGVQTNCKDGGAHVTPHESSFDEEILCLNKDSLSTDAREIPDENSLQLTQDGGPSISIRGLLPGDGDDLDSYSYDQSTTDTTEWMKSRCKTLGIEFDIVGEENVSDILGLDSESKVDNLMTMGGQFLNGAISEDSGIVLCTDGVNLVTRMASTNDAKCSDIIPICNLTDDLNSRTDQVLCTAESQSATSNLLHVSGATVPGVFGDLSSLPERSEMTFQSYCDKSNKLDSPPDLDSMSQSQTSVQSIMGTVFAPSPTSSQSLLGGVVNTAAVSASDSPITGILPNFLGIESTLTTPPGNELGILGEGSQSSSVDNMQQSVFLTAAENMDSDVVTAASSAESAVTPVNISDPGNVTLATICVSTDKEANSTQILVNTSQGQQLYMINTADLNQATNAIMPLAQPSERQSPSQGLAVVPPSGFLLLPVVDGNASVGAVPENGTLPSDGSTSQKQKNREIWLCSEPGCGRPFSKLAKLKIHAMQHTGERPFKCSKPGCDWAFTTAYKLKRHEESHEGKKEFYCDYEGCNRKFTTIYNLNSHRRLHERPLTESCPEEGCGQSFPTKRQLEIHMRVHNGEEKTYKCPHPGCKKVFFSPHSMGSHARMHDKNRPQILRCEFEGCGKEFDRLCRLKQHVRQHTGEKPYVCHYKDCTWAFTTASKLKRHQAKHLGLRKFQCPSCSKSFMRAEHLKGHMVTHTGVKPFKCPVEGCDVSFTAKSSLYVHLTKHDKDGSKLTFHCPMDGCSKKYSTKVALRNHIFKHSLPAESEGAQLQCPMDGCRKKYGTKAALRNHILKHYLSTTEGSNVSGQDVSQLLLAAQVALDSVPDDQDQSTEESSANICLSDSEPPAHMEEGGVEISSDQLTSAAVTQLMSSPVVIDAEPPPQVTPSSTNMLKICLDPRQNRLRLENRSGSARTDYQSNHMLSNRARRRWHQQRDHSQNVASVDAPLPSVHIQGEESSEKDSSLLKPDSDNFVSPDPSLGGLTFRDPETGITYMQTQLLQDDPPQSVLYNSDSLCLGGEAGGLGEGASSSIMDMLPTSHFTGTTINLQDLV